MDAQELTQPDYGTGHKKLNLYIMGLIICLVLTFIPFAAVMSHWFIKAVVLAIIYASALIQFFVQVIFFLRLNTETQQARINVMAIAFTFIILMTIVSGSFWIMWNLNYHMMS